MKEFLLLFRGGEAKELQQSPEKWQTHMQRWADWMGDLTKQGKFVGAQPLSNSGKTINGSSKMVTDGPFIEGKEMVGGYLICKVDTFDAALEIAKGCPILEFESGNVEVREIQEMMEKYS
ncbi:MAG: YciI family protein [Bacteroidetes bacterium]|nr:YciI family protein [Bacteroidota bacterium]